MNRAKRGFGSVRIVLSGAIVVVGTLCLTACGGGTSGAASASTGSTQTGGVSLGGSVVATPSDSSPGSQSGGSSSGAGSNGSTGSSPTAKTVNLQWQAPTENSDGTPLLDLKGYKIHYGTESQNYTGEISVDNPTVTTFLVDSLGAGKYFFAVTAYNNSGMESSLSDEVTATFN